MKKTILLVLLLLQCIIIVPQNRIKDNSFLAKLLAAIEINSEVPINKSNLNYILDSCLNVEKINVDIPVDLIDNISFYKINVISKFNINISKECKVFIVGFWNGEQIIYKLKGFRDNDFKELYSYFTEKGYKKKDILEFRIDDLDIHCLINSMNKSSRFSKSECSDFCGKIIYVK